MLSCVRTTPGARQCTLPPVVHAAHVTRLLRVPGRRHVVQQDDRLPRRARLLTPAFSAEQRASGLRARSPAPRVRALRPARRVAGLRCRAVSPTTAGFPTRAASSLLVPACRLARSRCPSSFPTEAPSLG